MKCVVNTVFFISSCIIGIQSTGWNAQQTVCLSSEFQCATSYKCIADWKQCDGNNDCLDNSDEVNCKALRFRRAVNANCPVFENGKWTTKKCESNKSANCSEVVMPEGIIKTCTLHNSQSSCETPITGTRMTFACPDLHVNSAHGGYQTAICNANGKWENLTIPTCKPTCGIKNTITEKTSYSQKVSRSAYPWLVAIYNRINYDQSLRCSGSLISPTLVLTTASCFCRPECNVDKYDLLVAAGKYYLSYFDQLDYEDKQDSSVSRYIIHPKFNENGLKNNDIAMVELTSSMRITPFVLPVCLDYDWKFDYANLLGRNGTMVMWGNKIQPVDRADHIEAAPVSFQVRCDLPNDFRAKYTNSSDKFCGRLNAYGNLTKRDGFCLGDYGGGLVYSKKNRFYIRGILAESVDKGPNGCSINEYSLYTSIQHHRDFILTHLDEEGQRIQNKNKKPGNCFLPRQVDNGKWKIDSNNPRYENATIGDEVDKGTVIRYKCDGDYKLFPSDPYVYCNDTWQGMPKCLKTCPNFNPSKAMGANCFDLDNNRIPCRTLFPGFTAEFKCGHLYETTSPVDAKGIAWRLCQNDGTWDRKLPKCKPVCGFASKTAQKLLIGGNATEKGDYPWQVGIYTAHNRQHICGGSLVSPKYSISAAHCFCDKQPCETHPEGYLLAAGKYYRRYNDPRDADAQYSKIAEVIIPELYGGDDKYFEYDIAVLRHSKVFEMTKYVQPVCLDQNKSFNVSTLAIRKGIVTGWGYTTSTGEPSEVLKELKVDYKSRAQCDLPSGFRGYYDLAPDKLCAGLTNRSASACQGDSGGGLVFYHPSNRNRFYLRGVVSVAPRRATGGCDETQLTLYTSIHGTLDFLLYAMKITSSEH